MNAETIMLTYARRLRATPGAIILAVSPGWADQDERRVAEEGDGGEIGETAVLPSPLCWHSRVSTKNSYKDESREMMWPTARFAF